MAEPARTLQLPSAPSGRSLPGLSLVKAPPDSQVGTPVRVVLLVVVIGALLFAVKTFVLGAPEEVPLDAASLSMTHVTKTPAAPGPALPAAATPPAAKAAANAKPKAKHNVPAAIDPAGAVAQAEQTAGAATARVTQPNTTAAAVAPDAALAPAGAVPPAAAGAPAVPEVDSKLPKAIAVALRRSEVVVVGLYAPDSAVSDLARREALAGAGLAGGGFVVIDVHRQKQVEPLTTLLGVIQDPTLIIFRRPGKVFVRMDGYIDRDTVAQAVANAKVAG